LTVKDQLERASLRIVLNIAEAGGRRSRLDKRRFYGYARGSATEVAALLDVLDGRRLAVRVVQMLAKADQALLKK
jgi:four helix bundle protein